MAAQEHVVADLKRGQIVLHGFHTAVAGAVDPGEHQRHAGYDSCQRRVLRATNVMLGNAVRNGRADVIRLVGGVVEDRVGADDAHDHDGQRRSNQRPPEPMFPRQVLQSHQTVHGLNLP
jgi:hypothetical protein